MLTDYSDKDLEAELKRRKTQRTAAPKPVFAPDYSDMRLTIITGVEKMVTDRCEDEDFRHYVYEAAMIAVYGPDYFKWRNAQKFGG